MKKKEELIHSIISSINWTYVTSTFKTLNLPWYEDEKPTKQNLISDFVDMLNHSIETSEDVISEYWMICTWENAEGELFAEAVFTPIVIYTKEKKSREGKLKRRLNIAIATENYEAAAKIKKTLDKIEVKK